MKSLTRAQSRVGALLVLGAAASLLILLIVYPLVGQYRAMGTAIDDKQIQIIRYQSLAANHEVLKTRLNQLKVQSRAAAHYVKGESAALASANMQQHLKRMLDRVGGELISTQRVGGRGNDNESATSLQVHMKADISTLLQVLYRLENTQPMFFVDDLSINGRPLRSTAQTKSAPVILDIRFNLTGYRQEAV
jgi:general secretion pathway protein M